jgi:N-acetylglutamate synthase-like GNAT family acetyltransferase
MRAVIERYAKNMHDLAEVKSLLALAAGRPTLDKLAYLIDQFYASTGRTMFICSSNNQITGIIGVEYTRSSHGFITHLAVHPDAQKKGIGEKLIKHVVKIMELDEIEAETDQDAVGFYDACGFSTREVNSLYTGLRRYRCVKIIKPEL